MAQEELVEGWTDPITQQLLNDGAAVNLTGCTVELLLYDANGRAITHSGAASVFEAATGKVKFQPGASDLLASKSPLRVRWKVTDDADEISYFPNASADVWIVRKP